MRAMHESGTTAKIPADGQHGLAEIESGFTHARDEVRQFLEQPDAGGAVSAFHIEIDGSNGIVTRSAAARVTRKRGIIEFAVARQVGRAGPRAAARSGSAARNW